MKENTRIAVVGAGLAGVTCARALHDQGFAVTVFDKSRGFGGRMATRRVDRWQWDHGAQYFQATDPAFAALLHDLERWPDAGKDCFVGVPGQNQLVKALAAPLAAELQSQVTAVHRHGAQWTLTINDVPDERRWQALVLAVPAPQARALLAGHPFAEALDPVVMAPCWALMVATRAAAGLPPVAPEPHAALAWLAADGRKPGRPNPAPEECYVLHATAAWSRARLEDTPARICDQLVEVFGELTDRPVPLAHAVAHRWRYALTEQPLGRPLLWDAAQGLGLCGDWCLGHRAEHAYLSGRGLANAMLTDLP